MQRPRNSFTYGAVIPAGTDPRRNIWYEHMSPYMREFSKLRGRVQALRYQLCHELDADEDGGSAAAD
jgi:hypothetical protein